MRAWIGLALLFTVAGVNAQVYLITGSFNQAWTYRFSSSLLELSKSGKLSRKAELVDRSEGFYWIRISYDTRLAAIAVPGEAARVRFLSLNSARIVKECPIATRDMGRERWLADVPGKGVTLELFSFGDDVVHDPAKVWAVDADPAIPCGASTHAAPLQQLRYIRPLGSSGVGDFTMTEGAELRAEATGDLAMWAGSAKPVALGLHLPDGLRVRDHEIVYLDGSNSQIQVVGFLNVFQGARRYFVVSRKSGMWRTIPEQLSPNGLRPFGRYVAIVEAKTKKAVAAQWEAHPGSVTIDSVVMKEEQSAGSEEWHDSTGPMGPSSRENFENSIYVFPGRLHIFDSETGKIFTITTSQGDSEILLIDNGTVYYRVGDALFMAPITGDGLGKARMLVKDEAIRHAHWAFTGR